jgi:hypothetical protein
MTAEPTGPTSISDYATGCRNWPPCPTGGGCASPGQKITNPGFESGTAPWSATAGVLGNTSGQPYSNLNKATGYSQKTFNVSAFAGQTVALLFTGTEDSSLQTSFVIDDTALSVS